MPHSALGFHSATSTPDHKKRSVSLASPDAHEGCHRCYLDSAVVLRERTAHEESQKDWNPLREGREDLARVSVVIVCAPTVTSWHERSEIAPKTSWMSVGPADASWGEHKALVAAGPFEDPADIGTREAPPPHLGSHSAGVSCTAGADWLCSSGHAPHDTEDAAHTAAGDEAEVGGKWLAHSAELVEV